MAPLILLVVLAAFQNSAAYSSKSINSDLWKTLQEGFVKTLTPNRLLTILTSFGFNAADVLYNVADFTEDSLISKRNRLDKTEQHDVTQMTKALRELGSICQQIAVNRSDYSRDSKLSADKVLEELLVIIRSKEFKSLRRVLKSNILQNKIRSQSYTDPKSRTYISVVPGIKRFFNKKPYQNVLDKHTEQALYEGLVT